MTNESVFSEALLLQDRYRSGGIVTTAAVFAFGLLSRSKVVVCTLRYDWHYTALWYTGPGSKLLGIQNCTINIILYYRMQYLPLVYFMLHYTGIPNYDDTSYTITYYTRCSTLYRTVLLHCTINIVMTLHYKTLTILLEVLYNTIL